jgi:WD40 repeat protein
LWDIATGQEIFDLADHTGGVFGLAFSPDGSLLASGGVDGVVQADFTNIQDLVKLARQRLTRSLTQAECEKYLHAADCSIN